MHCWLCEREIPLPASLCAACGAPQAPGRYFSAGAGDAVCLDQTHHFRLHFVTGSFAAQQLAAIRDRLEGSYSILVSLLQLDECPDGAAAECRLPSPIDVYLADRLDDPRQPGMVLTISDYAVPAAREMHTAFRPNLPGVGLERSLLLILLALAAENDRPRPPLIVAGLLALLMQRQGNLPDDVQINLALGAAKQRATLPSVMTLLSGPTPPTPADYLPAASFIGFLIDRWGARSLREFIRLIRPGTEDRAALAAFDRTIVGLNTEWQSTIKPARPGGLARFLRLAGVYLRPQWARVTEIGFYLALAVAFDIGLVKMQGLLLDRALLPRNTHALAVIMAVLAAGFVVVSLSALRRSYLTAYVSGSVLVAMSRRMFAHLQRLDPAFFHEARAGDVMSRMTNDLAMIEFAMTEGLTQGTRMLLTLAAAVTVIVIEDWRLAAVALIGLPLFFIAGHWLGPATARASRRRQERLGEVTSTLQENLGAQPVVKAFGLEQRMNAAFGVDLGTLFRSSIRVTFLASLFGLSANSIASTIQLIVLGLGGWLVIGSHLSVGTLIVFLGLLGQIIGPVQNLSGVFQSLQQASGAMDRVQELLKTEPAIKDTEEAHPAPPLAREIRFENVSFAYGDDRPALRNLDLIIPAGSNVALVGPSGSGKSTVLGLLLRFYDPRHGLVSFDGVDLRSATLDSVRGQTGMVFQESVLFNISIRENIRLGKLDATDEEVEAAARAAEIHDLIAGLPEGYDTFVGERGGRLSGGQRQRLAIARAIIRDPALLLLDEATSALDARTEAAISKTLARISRGRTTISVTHRLASTVDADRIYVFDEGALIEQGTHAGLLNCAGLYARLWHEQHNRLQDSEPSLALNSAG